MSMLSAMCEKLRIMARLVRDYDHREISRSLRDAADTIDYLRNTCNDLQFENEKLRELVRNLCACNGSCHRCVELRGKCEYEKQLRDLGVEVDE